MQHPIIHLEQALTQVLGRQVALGEDEEAPEDPGAVGLSNIVTRVQEHFKPCNLFFKRVLVDLKIFTFRPTCRSAWVGHWRLSWPGDMSMY